MNHRCIYCKRMAKKTVPMGDGDYACVICAQKSQDYAAEMLFRIFPHLRTLTPALDPQVKSKKETEKKRKKKKMKDLLTLVAFGGVMLFAGTTIKCDIDDGDKDKDKDKSAFVDVHGHDIQEAVSDAMPGALVDFRDPDYECIALGSVDRAGDTDFDVLFITACHELR